MSRKNYFFLLFTFYFGFFTKNKIEIKGKRQCAFWSFTSKITDSELLFGSVSCRI